MTETNNAEVTSRRAGSCSRPGVAAAAPRATEPARAGRSARALAATASALLMAVVTVALHGLAGLDTPIAVTAGAVVARVVYVPLVFGLDALRARATRIARERRTTPRAEQLG